jgi:hypothetical protein
MGDLSVTKTPVRGGEDMAEIALSMVAVRWAFMVLVLLIASWCGNGVP